MIGTELQIIAIVLGAIFGLVLAGAYIISKVRKQDMELIRQTNTDLTSALNAKGAEIRDLLVKQGTQEIEIKNLKSRIEILEHSNKTLESIFRLALSEYFISHPEVALQAKVI